MRIIKLRKLFLLAFFLVGINAHAEIQLPDFFTDHMVLQRDEPVTIWGWAEPGENIQVSIDESVKKAKAKANGLWKVTIPKHKAGGPFVLIVAGESEKIEMKDILYGDVWFCSGQSNMGWKLRNSAGATEEMSREDQPMIRLLTVDRTMSAGQQQNVTTSDWEICTASSMKDFSGVAYFFGQYLQQNLDVPIGLIHSSWGGTNVEAWMGKEAISDFSEYAKKIKVLDTLNIETTEENGKDNYHAWLKAMDEQDAGLKENWSKLSVDKSGWKKTELPGYWRNIPLDPTTGIVWVSKTVEFSKEEAESASTLSLGRVDDEDITYINGKEIQSSTNKDLERVYELPAGVFKAGENQITIRVKNKKGYGGFRSSKDKLFMKTTSGRRSLAGEWVYKQGTPASFPEIPYRLHPNDYPSLLYNGMVAPFTPMTIKGFIWYQGESNAKAADDYAALFSGMIRQWRTAWNDSELPFLFVQLSNYDVPNAPAPNSFARLRDAQTETLKVPYTGMALAVDIGESDNIHPANKKDVGIRLGLAARHIAYGEDIEYSGPVFESVEQKKDQVIVKFNHEEGLATNNDQKVFGFELAGTDKKFQPAEASISDGKIVVKVSGVKDPAFVRYAWADDPGPLNLVNGAGLPAVPFQINLKK